MCRPERAGNAPKALAIIPVYNEERNIGRVLAAAIESPVHEVLVVDDGSTDGTAGILAGSRATVLRHETRQGVGASLRDGLGYALRRGYEAVVVMAGNGKDDPRECGRLLSALWDEGLDYVQGSRFLRGGQCDMPLGRLIAVKAFSLLWTLRFRRRLTDVTNGFRAYRCSVLAAHRIDIWQDWLDGYELEYYLHYRVLAGRYKLAEVPVTKMYPAKPYTKIRPFADWYRIVRPFILLTLGLKR